jgi:hypothetical protein
VALVQGFMHVFLASMLRKEAPKPWLFHGKVAQPVLFRDCLLTLRDVVNTRFYRPDLWKLLDPVVSIEQEWVRLECFSSDGGVYARVDLSPNTFEEGEMGSPGTTNVDFGPDFAARLATLRPGKDSAFEVGEDSLTLHMGSGKAVERKVDLPDRWVRGFLQVQAIQRAAKPTLALGRNEARQLLTTIPAQTRSGEVYWASPSGRAEMLRPTGGAALGIEGIHRLKLMRRLAPLAQSLHVWAVGDEAPSFWTADLGAARVTMGLSSQVNQGFSGDGEALRSARKELAPELMAATQSLTLGTERFGVADAARKLSVDEGTAGQLVDLLSEQGLLGYDLAEGKFYPRHLPYVAQGFNAQARETNSRRMADEGRAELESRTETAEGVRLTGWVQGDHATYRVQSLLGPDGAIRDGSCTCPWILQHGMGRGPCKHILALRLAGGADETGSSL